MSRLRIPAAAVILAGFAMVTAGIYLAFGGAAMLIIGGVFVVGYGLVTQ